MVGIIRTLLRNRFVILVLVLAQVYVSIDVNIFVLKLALSQVNGSKIARKRRLIMYVKKYLFICLVYKEF